MNEESILKQSLLFTGKLVGVVALWVALVSVAMVTITSHAVGSLSGRSSDSADPAGAPGEHPTGWTSAQDKAGAASKPRTNPAPNAAKPNG